MQLIFQKHVCFAFHFILSLILFSGQDAAALTGIMRREENEKDEEDVGHFLEDLSPEDILRARMRDCGLFYIKETEKTWILFAARTMNSQARIGDPIETGVYIHWKADGPSSAELTEMQTFTGVDVRLFQDFTKSEGQIFVPCPPNKKLSVDTSKVRREWFPRQHPRWLVAIFPFQSDADEEHAVAVIPPFEFSSDFVEHFDFSSLH